MTYYVKQWLEVGGIPYPEVGYEDDIYADIDEAEIVDHEFSAVKAQVSELLNKPFDELTPQEWELLREEFDQSPF